MSQIGTSDMPQVHIFNYSSAYKITPIFVNDLKIVVGDMPYVEVKKIFDTIDKCNGVFSGAALNEFLYELSMLPYKTIMPLMKVIENKDKFGKYFEPVTH